MSDITHTLLNAFSNGFSDEMYAVIGRASDGGADQPSRSGGATQSAVDASGRDGGADGLGGDQLPERGLGGDEAVVCDTYN